MSTPARAGKCNRITFVSICASLGELAEDTWAHMEYQLVHGYRPPDERAFTDHNLVELSRRHYPAVQAKLFTTTEEAHTGADFELWFRSGRRLIGTLVQAKKLQPDDCYAGLARKVGAKSAAPRQIDLLIGTCSTGTRFSSYEPLYVFYNGPTPSRTPLPADRCRNGNVNDRQRGCTVARAREVCAALDAPGGPHEAASDIAPLAWPWQCLLCCPNASRGSLVERVRAFLGGHVEEGGWQPGEPGADGAPRVWEWEEVPDYIRLIANGDSPGEVNPEYISDVPGANRVIVIGDDHPLFD